MADFLGVEITGLDELTEFMKALPTELRAIVNREAAYYLSGTEARGLKHYPERVNHDPNTGGTPYEWESEAQRKYVMAKLRKDGNLPYNRTHDLRFGWQVDWDESGVYSTVYNDVPYAQFVQGENIQKGHKKDGWREIADIIESNMRGMIQAAEQGIQRFLNSRR